MLCSVAAPASASVDHAGTYWGSPPTKVFTPVEGLPAQVSQVSASNASGYFVGEGAEYAVGPNSRGQLGNGTKQESANVAVRTILPEGVSVASTGEAEASAVAIATTGEVYGWGLNPNGVLCTTAHEIVTPVKISKLKNIVAAAGGEGHMLYLLANSTVVACGQNGEGQLGNGTTKRSSVPVNVTGLTGIVEISAGQRSSCARNAAGEVFAWGGNASGQVGNGTTVAQLTPYHVPLPAPASQVACGGNLTTNGHALALVEGELYGWGADVNGQVGDGQTANKPSPTATGLHFRAVVASGLSSLGLDAEGNVYGWGGGQGYALGAASAKTVLSPVLVDTGKTMISGTALDSIDG